MGVLKNILDLLSSDNKTSISIDGKTYEGNSIKITEDGTVIIDGVLKSSSTPFLNISIMSPKIDSLRVTKGSLNIEGDVRDIQTTSGDVEVSGDITGNVSTTSGDVNVRGNIGGNVSTTSGDVETNKIQGSVKTVSGDIDKSLK